MNDTISITDYATPNVKRNNISRVWNTEKVKVAEEKILNGELLFGGSPFLEGDPQFRAENIVFEYSEEELAEIAKCATDIIYFANHYCHVMTDDGVKQIKLRGYQERVLKAYQDNRWVVFLSSRQSGKCFFRQTKVKILNKNTDVEMTIPFFYIFYFFNPPVTILGKIKFSLLKIEAFLTDRKIYTSKQIECLLRKDSN